MSERTLSGKAAIAGIGATDFSKDSGRSELRLAAEAVLDALDDAGLTPADVDGLTTFTMDSNTEVAVARAVGGPAVARVAVTHGHRDALELFSREARAPGVSFAPGTTSGSALTLNGRAAVEPRYRLRDNAAHRRTHDRRHGERPGADPAGAACGLLSVAPPWPGQGP